MERGCGSQAARPRPRRALILAGSAELLTWCLVCLHSSACVDEWCR